MPEKDQTTPKVLSANLFPVVGIGASAGGLDAFKKLLKAIPENSGMAYVLVQHLDPKHESLLPELLQKVTSIPVLEISDDIKVLPDHIYIIPSNKMMVANDGILQLSPRLAKSKSERNLSIDHFFYSLAEVHQSHAIGVVLSGTASDGTLGLKAIKDNGGMTFAQDEASAEYEGMPHSAAQAGVVDFILPPEKIPQKLLEITKIINGNGVDEQNLQQQDEDVFKQIISLLRIRKGADFTYYKQTTIRRRILRRMAINKNEDPAGYLQYLRENKPEQDILFQDMLIPVTSFFRDTKIFDNLCQSVFPLILKSKTADESIRVWVAGCSTGQEAYTIAICLKQFFGDKYNGTKVQIFATDMSEPAIAKARAGIYTKGELEGLTDQRLQEFFTKNNGGYQANKSIRDMCVFAVHNFLKDPPFGKIDFLSCRNVLIYLEGYLQKKALTTFHYSLNVKGFLLLGKSETTSGVPDLFATAGKHDKLFTRKDVPGRFMHTTSQRSEQSYADMNGNLKTENIRTDFQKAADDILLGKYTPAGVVVNEDMDIVHFRGSTGNYLEPSPGKASLNLLKMAKNGLGFELRNILHKAKKDNAPFIKDNIPLQVNGNLRNINIEAIPLPNIIEPHYLILFHDNEIARSQKSEVRSLKTNAKIKNEDKDLRIQQLEKELAQTREDMRSITEDQEAVNEELQSANEELLSGSEELQSLNEEMETSKEELQSTNEELMVVNQEMIGLNEQVSDARDYAEAIVTTVREPLLVLDKNLRVKSANSAFYKTFQVSELETEGRLIYELGDKQWNVPELRTLLEEILPRKTKFADFEVTHNFQNIGERVMLLNGREITREKIEEKLILLSIDDVTEKTTLQGTLRLHTIDLEKNVQQRTFELSKANEELQKKNQEIALSKYNKRFLTEFSEKFSAYKFHNEFFNSLVQFIADTTGMDYVFVGKLQQNDNDELTIQTMALNAFGKAAENIIYPLPDGPCEQVIQGTLYSYPSQCRQTFPKNKTIEQFNVEGYLAYPLNDETGNAVGLIAVMHRKSIEDAETVSSVLKIVAKRAEIELERIKNEEQLVKHNKTLEEKTSDLEEANKNLEISNASLEQFAYVASHDLQEPLRKIQTFAGRLLDKEKEQLSEDVKSDINKIITAANRMRTLIGDVLNYSRIIYDDHSYIVTDLNKILANVLVDFDLLIDQKKAVINYGVLPVIEAVPLQMSQLFYNLIANALKFTKKDIPPVIDIIVNKLSESQLHEHSNLKTEREYFEFVIKDNGIGFNQQYAEQVFNIFQRLNGFNEYAGTGIGLAMCRKIALNHGGEISAEAKENEGAIFHIILPAKQG